MVRPIVSQRITPRAERLATSLENAASFVRTNQVRDCGDVALVLRPYLELAVADYVPQSDGIDYFIMAAETGEPGKACAEGDYYALVAALREATGTNIISNTGTESTANVETEYSVSQRLWITSALLSAATVLRANPAIESDVTALGLLVHPAMLRATAAKEAQDHWLDEMGTLLNAGNASGWQGRSRRERLLATVRELQRKRLAKARGGLDREQRTPARDPEAIHHLPN